MWQALGEACYGLGRLDEAERAWRRALALRDAFGETECTLTRGDALVLRPLLLHASSKGNGHSRRRVLHFVFGPRELPCGLRWPEAAV